MQVSGLGQFHFQYFVSLSTAEGYRFIKIFLGSQEDYSTYKYEP